MGYKTKLSELIGELTDKEELKVKESYYQEVLKLRSFMDRRQKWLEVFDDDWRCILNYSIARKIMNFRNGVKDQGFSEDMKLCEILGYMAELVVAQEYDVDFDYTITPRSGSYDLIIKDKRIDVKICKPVVMIGKW